MPPAATNVDLTFTDTELVRVVLYDAAGAVVTPVPTVAVQLTAAVAAFLAANATFAGYDGLREGNMCPVVYDSGAGYYVLYESTGNQPATATSTTTASFATPILRYGQIVANLDPSTPPVTFTAVATDFMTGAEMDPMPDGLFGPLTMADLNGGSAPFYGWTFNALQTSGSGAGTVPLQGYGNLSIDAALGDIVLQYPNESSAILLAAATQGTTPGELRCTLGAARDVYVAVVPATFVDLEPPLPEYLYGSEVYGPLTFGVQPPALCLYPLVYLSVPGSPDSSWDDLHDPVTGVGPTAALSHTRLGMLLASFADAPLSS